MCNIIFDIGISKRKVKRKEGDGTSAGRAANTMDIVLCPLRDVEIHHQSDARDIETSRSDISGDENLRLPRFESIDGMVTFVLSHEGMERRGLEA